MKRLKRRDTLLLGAVTALAAVLFAVLYWQSRIPIETPQAPAGALEVQSVPERSGAALEENKDIYKLDTHIYDVYLSIFPTKNEEGNLLDFSAFDLHTAGDYSYNPTLNCNIQILPEGKTPDPLLNLDYKNATIRVRGSSARGHAYKSYKVKLDQEAGDFFGQKSLNINKHCGDISKVSTKLSADLLSGIDNIAGYRTYFMRLWIRDGSLPRKEQKFEYYGLYTEIEQPNKTYLRARNLDENGSLYKARDFSFALNSALRNVDDPEYSREEFERVLGIQAGENHEKLLEMMEAVNDTTRDFQDVFAQYFNEDNYLTWLAFNLLMGNEDILNRNFLLYSPQDSQTWYLIPWDFDQSLRFGDYESPRPESLRGIQKLVMVVLHRRYFRMEGSIEKLDGKMQELLNTSITRERVTELVEAYKPILEKTVTAPPDGELLICAPDQMFPYLDGLYDGILHNYDIFKIAAEYPMPGFVASPERLSDGSVRFAWDPFYSLEGLPITYNIRIYSDFNMQNLLYEASGISQTEYFMEEGLPGGTYYVLVTGTDSKGRRQLSLEHVEGWDGSLFYYIDGLREFTLE